MRNFIAYIGICLICVVCSCTSSEKKKSREENSAIFKNIVQVKTIKEFCDAINPYTKIEIVTDVLTISDIESYESDYASYTNNGLVITGVHHLIISGLKSNSSKILTNNGFSFVISLNDAKSIVFSDLVIGHAVSPDECTAGVINISNSKNIEFINCELFGSGTVGLELVEVNGFSFNNSVIKECSEGIITAETSIDLRFHKCKFEENKGYDLFYFTNCSQVLFEMSRINANEINSHVSSHNVDNALFFTEGYTFIKLIDCEILENSMALFKNGDGKLEVLNGKAIGNTWQDTTKGHYNFIAKEGELEQQEL